MAQTKEFHRNANQQRELFFLNIFGNHPYKFFLFNDASWLPNSQIGGSGFYVVNAYNMIVVAGCSNLTEYSALEAKLTAVEHGLKAAAEEMINIAVIFTDCCSVKQIITHISSVDDGQLKRRLEIFRRSYNFNNLSIEVIPCEWNNLVDKLVVHGRSCHGISLFPSKQESS